jgi:hypothetical protein
MPSSVPAHVEDNVESTGHKVNLNQKCKKVKRGKSEKKFAREGFTRTSLIATLQPIPTQEVRVSHDHQVGMSVGQISFFLKISSGQFFAFKKTKKSKKLQGL